MIEEGAVRQILRNLAHAVHVVGETQEPGRHVAQQLKRPPDHVGARHLAKGADMRQARWPITGLEQHMRLAGARDARHQLSRLLEWPGLGCLGGVAESLVGGHGSGHPDELRAASLRSHPSEVNLSP